MMVSGQWYPDQDMVNAALDDPRCIRLCTEAGNTVAKEINNYVRKEAERLKLDGPTGCAIRSAMMAEVARSCLLAVYLYAHEHASPQAAAKWKQTFLGQVLPLSFEELEDSLKEAP